MNASAHLKFPPRKAPASGVTEARRDDGAHNQSLPCSEAELVSFTAPIARHTPEAHETPKLTRDSDGVLRVVSRGQLPGCLPPGYDLDSLLTVEQFAIWRQKSVERVRNELPITKGVVGFTQKDKRIHPRTFLELSIKRK